MLPSSVSLLLTGFGKHEDECSTEDLLDMFLQFEIKKKNMYKNYG